MGSWADHYVVPQHHLLLKVLLLCREKSEATRSCKLWKRGDRQELTQKTIDT